MLNIGRFASLRRVRGGAATAAVLLALAVAGARQPKVAPLRPNVVLVTLDTTRADRLGCYGRADAGTPNLDRLAARGVRFADAWSVAPITLPAHLSVLTGCTPVTHGVRDNGAAKYDGRIPTLAVRFAAIGYRTAAVVSASVLDADWGANVGFGIYDDRFDGKRERSAASATARALQILQSSTEPLFLWVHYFDPHFKYDPPAPFAERYRDDPYQGEIASVDFELGRLLAELDKAARKSIVVVVADHGESLGEHGERTHGIFTYRSTLSVPLIIAGPGIPAGRVVVEPVSIVDLAPTVAELTGLAKNKVVDGISLAGTILRGEAAPRSRSLYYESMLPFDSYGWVAPRGEADGRYAFIDLPTRELYDLRSDAGQTRNLYAAEDPLSQKLARRFERLAAGLDLNAGQSTPATLTEEQRAKLSSLGYFPGVPMGTAKPTLDPKDVIDLADRIEQAMQLHHNRQFDEAIAIADEVIRRNPDNVRARSIRGQALLAQKRFREAVVELGEVVARAPTIAVNRWDLGVSLAGAGEPAKAQAEWRKAIELEPRFAEARVSLLASYRGRGEAAQALELAKDSAASGAESAELDVEIGLAYANSGDVANAERWLESALRRRPGFVPAIENLGRVAYEHGRVDDALLRYRAASVAAPGESRFPKKIATILLNDRNDRAGALAAYRAALAVERDPREREKLEGRIAELSRQTP